MLVFNLTSYKSCHDLLFFTQLVSLSIICIVVSSVLCETRSLFLLTGVCLCHSFHAPVRHLGDFPVFAIMNYCIANILVHTHLSGWGAGILWSIFLRAE